MDVEVFANMSVFRMDQRLVKENKPLTCERSNCQEAHAACFGNCKTPALHSTV